MGATMRAFGMLAGMVMLATVIRHAPTWMTMVVFLAAVAFILLGRYLDVYEAERENDDVTPVPDDSVWQRP